MPAIDFTFDGSNKKVIITSGVTTVDVQDMYSRWKQWATTSENSKYLQAFRTFGGDPTIAGQFAPRYYFLRNGWRVSVNNNELVSVGTNLYTEELDSPYIIGTGSSVSDSNSDAVVVDNGIAENLDYNGLIHINPSIGTAGIVYPAGTVAQPVTNITDAKTIALSRGINSFHIYGTVPFNVDFNNFIVHGGKISDVALFQGVNVSGTTFKECVLAGSYVGDIAAEVCQLYSGITGMAGTFKDCGLMGPMNFNSGVNSLILNCSSMVPGSGSPSFHLDNDVSISLRKYSGGIMIYDCLSGSVLTTEFMAGNLQILSGCTGGEIIARGIAGFLDQSSGTTVDTTGLLVPYAVASQHSINVNTEITRNK